MKKGKYQSATKRQAGPIVILIIAAALMLMIVSLVLIFRPKKVQAKLPSGETEQMFEPIEKNKDSISIPGYEGITLKADSKEQEIGFPNPAQNTCYFQISLILEDGTVLWQSELVEPGEISEPILLEEPLEAGTYLNSLLKFDCYTMDGTMRALNGAATKMTIYVK